MLNFYGSFFTLIYVCDLTNETFATNWDERDNGISIGQLKVGGSWCS